MITLPQDCLGDLKLFKPAREVGLDVFHERQRVVSVVIMRNREGQIPPVTTALLGDLTLEGWGDGESIDHGVGVGFAQALQVSSVA